MKELKLSRHIVMPLSGLFCIALASCDPPTTQLTDAEMIQRANEFLSSAQLPTLPVGATDARYWDGGEFAKFVNVKFSVSPDQALGYFKAAGAKYYFEYELDSDRSAYHVSATHFLADSEDDVAKPNLFELNHRTGIVSQPWFRSVYDIRHGWYHDSQDGAVGFHFYYDLDTHEFYVYWHYS
jgi:hypothetical protein